MGTFGSIALGVDPIMNKEKILATYAANLPPDSKQRSHYIKYAEEFIDYAKSLDRENVNAFVSRLQHKGNRPGTVNFIFRVIRRLFSVNGVEWPFRRGEGPKVDEMDEYRPELELELVVKMIQTARSGEIGTAESCMLALATTYAFRREEMANLTPTDVDLEAGMIICRAAKGGRVRVHRIPEAILPYLQAHDFSTTYSPRQMSQMFWRIVNASGLEELQEHRLGWHVFRHLVPKLLRESGIDAVAVHRFMGWSGARDELAMDIRYHSTTVIGLKGRKPVLDRAKGDIEIFQKHPLLKIWLGGKE